MQTAKHEIIKLEEPVVGHEVIREYKLRKPTAKDILPVGWPFSFQRSADGSVIYVENNAAIEHYCEACVVEVDQLALFSQMGVTDTLALREKILDFFREAGRTKTPSGGSSTASTSTSSGAPETPAA